MSETTAHALVCEVIAANRSEGMDRAYALAGRMFGFAARRARAYWHHEITDPRDSEASRIRAAYAAWVDQEMRRLDAQRALLAARREAVRGPHGKTPTELRPVARATVDRRIRLDAGPG